MGKLWWLEREGDKGCSVSQGHTIRLQTEEPAAFSFSADCWIILLHLSTFSMLHCAVLKKIVFSGAFLCLFPKLKMEIYLGGKLCN